jgi:hypothetical protein
MHWQVKSQNMTAYHDPSKVQLALFDCKLIVQPSAWVQCDEVQVLPLNHIGKNETDWNVRFNPRVHEWRNKQGDVMSGEQFPIIFTYDRSLFVMGDAYECQDYDSLIRTHLSK